MVDRSSGSGLDPFLLEVIVCPACHGPLTDAGSDLTCAACSLAYPIRDGIPVLLADEAQPSDASPPTGPTTSGTA